MFLQLFSRKGQFLPLPLALPLPVVNLFGQWQCQCHSGSRCSKRIVIVNQSRRLCHLLTMWPQLLSRFGNRWRILWLSNISIEYVVELMATSTCHTMKVDHHVLIASWLVTCSSNSMYFPRYRWDASSIVDTLCWKTAKLAMNVATCRSPWLWALCTANGGANKRNPDNHSHCIALDYLFLLIILLN